MNIQGLITIDFSNTAELTAIATALSTLGVSVSLTANPAPYSPPANTTSEQPAAKVTTYSGLNIGDNVHWKGSKYEFDGVVEKLAVAATSDESKAVWVRRADTNTLVSLTIGDLARHGITVQGASTPAVSAPAVPTNRITSAADAMVGQAVHWAGQKFDFDGVVLSVKRGEDIVSDGKCVFLRRNDTGKKVSLTADDLLTGSLTRI